jgi:hypothetical protein
LETKAPWKLRKREREIPEDLTGRNGGNGEEKLIESGTQEIREGN